MSCLDRRMTFPAYLAYCGMKKAACCDGRCSALQGQMQHVALADDRTAFAVSAKHINCFIQMR